MDLVIRLTLVALLFYLGVVKIASIVHLLNSSKFGNLMAKMLVLFLVFSITFFGNSNFLFAPFILLILIAENMRPRRDQSIFDFNNVKNVQYLIFKRSIGLLFFALFYVSRNHIDYSSLVLLDLKNWPAFAKMIFVVLTLDLGKWFLHRAFHKFDFLWKFHRVHHSIKEFNSISFGHTHWVEHLSANLTYIAVAIIAFNLTAKEAFFAYIFPLAIIAGYWAHANVELAKHKFWDILEYFITTPRIHVLHHDVRFMTYNYSELFPIWDRLFGTYKAPTEQYPILGIGNPEFENKSVFEQQRLH